MTKNTKTNFLDKILLTAGLLWIFNRAFNSIRTPTGIYGASYLRKLKPYIDRNGRRWFEEELKKFEPNEVSVIISNMIIRARKNSILSQPLFKTLQGTKITAELRYSHFRILLYKISNDDYLMLSVFKKKTNETPKREIEKAENRLAEYLAARQ